MPLKSFVTVNCSLFVRNALDETYPNQTKQDAKEEEKKNSVASNQLDSLC